MDSNVTVLVNVVDRGCRCGQSVMLLSVCVCPKTRPGGSGGSVWTVMLLSVCVPYQTKVLRLNKRTPIARVPLRRHSTDPCTDNKQAQECAACACMLLHCCAALMHRADACAALQLLLLPVCCGACSRRPPCIIRVARRRLATQMCLCRGCCQTWRWHLRPCAHRHTADTRPRTRDTRA